MGKLKYTTKNFICNGKPHCSYCGKEIEEDVFGQMHYYHCDCKDALWEIKVQGELDALDKEYDKKAKEIAAKLPNPKYRLQVMREETVVPIKNTY